MSRAAAVALLAALGAACIGGPVLRGYPGYPFQSFSAPATADSSFLRLQTLLADEGFPLDYTRLEEGLINTRPSDEPETPLFLSVVVAADSASGGSRVWVAGFTEAYGGPRRVNPNDRALWARVVAVSEALSRGLSGAAPVGPDAEGAEARGR